MAQTGSNASTHQVVHLWESITRAPADVAPPVAITPEVNDLIAEGAAVGVGVSGGKDSVACAIAVARHLDQIGHTGPRVLVHSDLGRVEWRESILQCQALARHLGWELMVVRRQAGDMLDRWQVRWHNNLQRYIDLTSARLILPWSTPALRFCTSELKTSVIASALKKRFAGHHIVNATGVRRQESAKRARLPVASRMSKLERRELAGVSWNAIIDFKVEDVLGLIASEGLELHEAYTRYGTSRVSCVFCIMSSQGDLLAAASCEDNHAVYVEMVELEAQSTFAFQGSNWLADVAPHLLSSDLQRRIETAKRNALRRQALEATIPAHLLFVPGKPWPQAIPTLGEAVVLAGVRREVLSMLCAPHAYVDARAVRDRYHELMLARPVTEREPAFA